MVFSLMSKVVAKANPSTVKARTDKVKMMMPNVKAKGLATLLVIMPPLQPAILGSLKCRHWLVLERPPPTLRPQGGTGEPAPVP